MKKHPSLAPGDGCCYYYVFILSTKQPTLIQTFFVVIKCTIDFFPWLFPYGARTCECILLVIKLRHLLKVVCLLTSPHRKTQTTLTRTIWSQCFLIIQTSHWNTNRETRAAKMDFYTNKTKKVDGKFISLWNIV